MDNHTHLLRNGELTDRQHGQIHVPTTPVIYKS